MSFKEDFMNWLSGYKENEQENPQPKEETKEEVKPKEEEPKLDSKDLLIKSLQEEILGYKATISSKDEIINQNNEQIIALKEMTSVNNPINNDELSLEELIINNKGEL